MPTHKAACDGSTTQLREFTTKSTNGNGLKKQHSGKSGATLSAVLILRSAQRAPSQHVDHRSRRDQTPNNNNPLHHHLQGRRLNLRTSLVVQHETQLGHALTKMHNPHAAGGGSGDTTKPGNYNILRH